MKKYWGGNNQTETALTVALNNKTKNNTLHERREIRLLSFIQRSNFGKEPKSIQSMQAISEINDTLSENTELL